MVEALSLAQYVDEAEAAFDEPCRSRLTTDGVTLQVLGPRILELWTMVT